MQITGEALAEALGIPAAHAALMDESPDEPADQQDTGGDAALHELVLTFDLQGDESGSEGGMFAFQELATL
jgi:hypothetical protein